MKELPFKKIFNSNKKEEKEVKEVKYFTGGINNNDTITIKDINTGKTTKVIVDDVIFSPFGKHTHFFLKGEGVTTDDLELVKKNEQLFLEGDNEKNKYEIIK